MQEFKRHPKRPDELRIEQLKEPWEETGALPQAAARAQGISDSDFDTSCAMKPPQLFDKDTKSIFIPGTPVFAVPLLLLTVSCLFWKEER